jgi:hypothetical protein
VEPLGANIHTTLPYHIQLKLLKNCELAKTFIRRKFHLLVKFVRALGSGKTFKSEFQMPAKMQSNICTRLAGEAVPLSQAEHERT